MLDKIKNFFMLKEGTGTAFYYGTILFTVLTYLFHPLAAAFCCFLVFFAREAWRYQKEKEIHYKTIFLGVLPSIFSAIEPYAAPYVGEWFPMIKNFIVGLF